MANLFPTENVNNSVPLDDIKQNIPVGYKQSINFDDKSGDFSRNGQYRAITAAGVEAWKQWCMNCLETERYSKSSYSTDFGINTKLVFKLQDKSAREILLQKEITEALKADDYKRTVAVSDFKFNWFAPDAVEVSMKILGIENASIDITARLGG